MNISNNSILAKLNTGEPIFCSFPKPTNPTIIGLESELGSSLGEVDETMLYNIPRWLSNGGFLHIDCSHLEACIPETSNAVSATIYHRALLEQVYREFRFDHWDNPIRWYANSYDWRPLKGPTTFGHHESYSTSLSRSFWGQLGPFLVARTLIGGAGLIDFAGNFNISQRARFIHHFQSTETTQERGIICQRHNSKSPGDRGERIHLICGENNLNQVGLFLKLAFTTLVIEMAETNQLPQIPFNPNGLVQDLHRLSASTTSWIFNRKEKNPKSWLLRALNPAMTAIQLLWIYFNQAEKLFKGRDQITDVFLVIMADTLRKLEQFETNVEKLSRRLDWVLKLWFSRLDFDNGGFDRKGRTMEDGVISDQDLEYHRLGEGFQILWERAGGVEILVDPSLIENAIQTPPTDTRASFRGWLVDRLKAQKGKDGFGLTIFEWKQNRWNICQVERGPEPPVIYQIADPFDSFHRYRSEVVKLF